MEKKMKKTLLILALSLATSLLANSCKYTVHSSALEWTAFKTPAKIGVKGTFDNIKLNFDMADSQVALLESSSVDIVTAHINSNNPGRDAKLVKNFFFVQGVRTIKAQILKVNKDTANVEISMNSVKKVITMQLNITKNTIKLTGAIDLADFNMLPSLNAITKACYDLHKGKTWQDVNLEFKIQTDCK